MSDALKGFKPLDPGRINTMDPVEMQYWCREFHCTEMELSDAVSEVGEHIAAVRDWFESRHSGGKAA